MNYKDILVFLDDGKSNEVRVKTAIYLAKSHGATLTGVSIELMRPEHLRVQDEDAAELHMRQFAEQLTREFQETMDKEGIEASTIIIPGKISEASREMARLARNFDLVMLRQPNPDKENYSRLKEFAEDVMLHCGRPIFFMPYIGVHRIPCRKSMISWDGSPGATRALHDSFPIISKSEEVYILVVESKKANKEEAMIDELLMHLGRHGINAKPLYVKPAYEIQTVIQNHIADYDIDILIMGGYGTPSFRQKIFGGVTSSILESMITPILMSH